MAEMHRIYGTDTDVEIGDVWRAQWQVVSAAGWITANTVPEVFSKHEEYFTPAKPFVLVRYETCAVSKDTHGVYRDFGMPVIDAEDAPVVRNLQYVAFRNAKDYSDPLPDGKICNELFDITEFLP